MTDTINVSASGKASITKDPDAILDYSWDWGDWLAEISSGTTIASHEILVVGCVCESHSDDGIIVTAFISGGAIGELTSATCRITTNDTPSRTEDRTIYFKIKER